ncbi:hypothetical protein WJX72_003383 [[Myrmecia] bisecta]|uniref:Uncharacterized protein n=1 Tax=[Myrmecia] bisecta TaxID=41462 RepID=A0AAW1P5S5_9CHLO
MCLLSSTTCILRHRAAPRSMEAVKTAILALRWSDDAKGEAIASLTDDNVNNLTGLSGGVLAAALKKFMSQDRAGEASTSDNWGFHVGKSSSEGLPSNFKDLQSRPSGPLFLTHRPASAQAIPFALLDEGFALFLDVQAGRKGKTTSLDYQMAVELCHVASSLLDKEKDRQVAVTEVLERYLHCVYKCLKISTGKAGQPPETNGTATVMRNGEEFPYLWGELKLEVGQDGADPQAESVLYFFHFIRMTAGIQRMLPGLIIEQFGAYFRISGIANVGEHIACEPLTPALHLLDLRPHQPDYMEQLTQTLRALRLTAKHYRIGYETGNLPELEASPLPYVLRRSRNAVVHGEEAGHDVLSRAVLTSGALQLRKDRLLTPYARPPDSDQLEKSAGQTAIADDTRSASVSAPAADVRSSAAPQPGSSSAKEDHAEADLSGDSPGPSSDPASSLPLAGAVKVQPGCEVPTKLLYKTKQLHAALAE